jgi:hypothetical protein
MRNDLGRKTVAVVERMRAIFDVTP